jgi:hypothetical protein
MRAIVLTWLLLVLATNWGMGHSIPVLIMGVGYGFLAILYTAGRMLQKLDE